MPGSATATRRTNAPGAPSAAVGVGVLSVTAGAASATTTDAVAVDSPVAVRAVTATG